MYRFAAAYFVFFVGFGVYVPWLPPFLEARGLSAATIGLSLALVQIARGILPPAWGWLADRLGTPRRILGWSSAVAGLTLVTLLLPGGSSSLTLRLLLYGVLLVPVMPLLETLTLAALAGTPERYGPVRLWGSLGFMVSALAVGSLIPLIGVSQVPLLAGVPIALTGLFALTFPAARASGPRSRPRLAELPWATLVPLLVAAFLVQLSHGPYYVFFSLQLGERGVPSWIIGGLWSLGVLAEVGLMAVSPRWLPRLGLWRALRWALILTAARWLLLSSVESLAWVAVAQLLHAASYAVVHLTTLQLVDQLTPQHSKAFTQSVLSAAAWGAGIGAGLALAGVLVGPLGYDGLYLSGALCAVAAWGAMAVCRQLPERSSPLRE